MKTILLAAISADGCIDGGENTRSTDWTSDEDTQFFIKKTKAVGTVVMGRKTFETFPGALPDRHTFVMTRQPDQHTDTKDVTFTDASPEALLQRLAGQGREAVVIAGGTSIYGQFLKNGLIDEVFLTVEPVLFGSDKRLCVLDQSVDMELEDVQQLGRQTVLLHYSVTRG